MLGQAATSEWREREPPSGLVSADLFAAGSSSLSIVRIFFSSRGLFSTPLHTMKNRVYSARIKVSPHTIPTFSSPSKDETSLPVLRSCFLYDFFVRRTRDSNFYWVNKYALTYFAPTSVTWVTVTITSSTNDLKQKGKTNVGRWVHLGWSQGSA